VHLHDPTRRHPRERRADLPLTEVDAFIAESGPDVIYVLATPVNGHWDGWQAKATDRARKSE
jgi:hypothetical protein